ncbi:aspartate aminotransferase family protein [Cyclobacterium jeungdonense]|uniref:Aspartate aminotransferase family protein n=1 Tax=Cyclobacterium jeungdonense TaxID=708087 RepID=A0ABT8C8T0_9BACT|nr:aspartate aminotransferase family protein [Cyclobacterium jeungdonense]MDN3688776.1 aspartate aminotransferase family protein [Cyclobacterium jeungdonense]
MKKYDYSQSARWLDRAKKVLASGVSSEFRKYNHPHALFYTHGKGSKLYDVDGNEYLDFTLSQGPLILGHSHPEILEAVQTYSLKGQLFAGQHAQEIELAEKLQQLIPSAERIRFCLDGSEAVQTALRVARSKTGKQKFLRFEGHYHGWLDNVCYGISTPASGETGPRNAPVIHPWSQGLSHGSAEEFFLLPWNNLELVQELVKQHHQDLAAIITEPVMCNNGCIPPKEGFLQGLRKICDQYGIALILDEVITGFRLGLSGAQGLYSILPDMAVFAKALGSGYPISAVVGKKEWMEEIASARVIHAGTMNAANPTVAAALATVSILERENPYPTMFALGDKLRQGLRQLAKDTGQPLLVSGIGPIAHTGFSDKNAVFDFRDVLSFDKGKLKHFISGMHDRGLRVIGRGLWYISAVHTEAEIDRALEIAKDALTEMKS